MINESTRMTDVDYSEKAVLSVAIKYPEKRRDIRLKPEHFADKRHAAILEAIVSNPHFAENDLLSMAVKDSKKYGGFEFANDIANFPLPTRLTFKTDQMDVYRLYKHREISKLVDEYKAAPTDEAALEISGKIIRLNQFDINGDSAKIDVMSEILDDMHNPKSNRVIPTGFKELDHLITGFEDGQLNVVAARPSIGKTAFAIELGKNLATEENQVVFCSMETRERNITERILANIAKVPLVKFKNPSRDMNQDEMDRVLAAMDVYNKMNLRVMEKPKMTPNEIRGIANSLSEAEHGIIIIDYLQLMQSDSKHNSKYEEVSHISRELKIIVQEFENITIVAIAQLNRSVEQRQDKRPMMSDLRDSGGIEQDSNMIMMLYRDDYYYKPEEQDAEPGAPSTMDVIVAKSKDGATGTAQLKFYKTIQRLY